MLDLGNGIAIGMACMSAAAVIITAIKVRGMSTVARAPGPYNGDKKQAVIHPCPEHSGMVATYHSIQDGLNRVEKRMEDNFREIFSRLDRMK